MAVEVGQEAPDFELKDQHGTPVRLSSFRGAKNVVLVFYPLAFSGVCSSELYAMRDEFPEASRDDVELLTVSVDSTFTHRAWSDQEHFEFGLLSDFWPHGGVAQAYGVFDEDRGIATRGTFIIDKAGVVQWKVVNPIPHARDLADYQKALAALG
jgi:peroxiredoxin